MKNDFENKTVVLRLIEEAAASGSVCLFIRREVEEGCGLKSRVMFGLVYILAQK